MTDGNGTITQDFLMDMTLNGFQDHDILAKLNSELVLNVVRRLCAANAVYIIDAGASMQNVRARDYIIIVTDTATAISAMTRFGTMAINVYGVIDNLSTDVELMTHFDEEDFMQQCMNYLIERWDFVPTTPDRPEA